MAFLGEAVKKLFGGEAAAAPGVPAPAPTKLMETTVQVQINLAANLPANSLTHCKLMIDPTTGFQDTIQIPPNEVWVIDDIFVSASQTVDGQLVIRRNTRDVMTTTHPINSLLISNPSRPKLTVPLVFKGGEIIDAQFINLAAVGASAVTEYALVHVTRYIYE